MVVSGWFLGVQNSHRRFFWSYASAALWSIAQIAMLVGWGSRAADLAQLAWWLAWATLAGSLLQIAAQVPEVVRLIGTIRPRFDRTAEGVAPVMRNLLPVVTAVGVVQISSFIDQQIASFLPEGAISYVFYASLIALLPVSIFGISVAASALPDFSRDSTNDSYDVLRERLRASWQRILFYIVPSAVAIAAFGDYCNGIIYRTGLFGAEQQRIVHFVLAGYAIGLVSFASVKLLASAFYAMQDYRTPLRASVASLTVSAVIAASIALPLRNSVFAAAGIALGSAIGSYTNFAVLMRRLRARLGPIYTPAMWSGTRRIIVAAIVALLVATPMRFVLDPSAPFDPSRPRLTGPPILLAFGLAYVVCAWWLGSGEAARLLRRPRRGGASAAG
jgi:putative peptidoglycan lipid II flippase